MGICVNVQCQGTPSKRNDSGGDKRTSPIQGDTSSPRNKDRVDEPVGDVPPDDYDEPDQTPLKLRPVRRPVRDDAAVAASRFQTPREIVQVAIKQGLSIRIDYEDASGHRTKRKLSPASLTGDMLVAYCHEKEAGRHFKVSRIQSAQLLRESVNRAHLRIALEAASEPPKTRSSYYSQRPGKFRPARPVSSGSYVSNATTPASDSGCLTWIAIIVGGLILLRVLG